ncbi:unnamed protein product [Soboliphyme baturini]|uniref:Sialin n=1 Tax=Soboliphyme baturini TaxID=241478 RepID=A0A183IF61_9BILA|nr:unnamed protein product [Soboliphyme baturini]
MRGLIADPSQPASIFQEPVHPLSTTFSVPWNRVFKSKPVWAVFLSHFSNNWAAYVLLTDLPLYFKEVLGFYIKYDGVLTAIPYLAQATMFIFAGSLADILRLKFKLKTETVRKIMDASVYQNKECGRSPDNNIYISLPCVRQLNEKLRRIGFASGPNLVFKPSATLRSRLCHLKTQKPKEQKAGWVYQLPYSCGAVYLGETGHILPAIFLVAVGCVGCDTIAVVSLLSASTAFSGLCAGGFVVNLFDLCPKFAGLLFGISTTIGSIPGTTAPVLTGYLLQRLNVKLLIFQYINLY